jgi:hypothetical protein
MAGLDPAIHVFMAQRKMWMPATSAGMTVKIVRPSAAATNRWNDDP